MREPDEEEEEDEVEDDAAADEEDVADAFLVEVAEDAFCVEAAADLDVAADVAAADSALRSAPVAEAVAVGKEELREKAVVGWCERHLPALPLAVELLARRFKERELWREERREPWWLRDASAPRGARAARPARTRVAAWNIVIAKEWVVILKRDEDAGEQATKETR